MLQPLRNREFRLLWFGETVSLMGDVVYFVAIAWQVYELSNAPTALSLVGAAWTLPTALFLVIGGVVTDRFDRRVVLLCSNLIRAVAIGILGLLSILGILELWHVFVLVAVYGVGEAFFGPVFGAVVPDLVPPEQIVEANALDQFVRPFAVRMIGPAVGGLLVAAFGTGQAFMFDAASFVVAAGAAALMRPIPAKVTSEGSRLKEQIGEGFRFVRAHVWLWGTLCSAGLTLLFFWGPVEVLLPFIIKNELGGSSSDFGVILAAGGAGAVIAAIAMGQLGIPRRHITFMYLAWFLAVAPVSLFGLVTEVWQAMVISAVLGAGATTGLIVWGTLMHRLVPKELLGRVTSLDWLVSISLVPVSYALTGPIASLVGARETIIGAGILGGAMTLVFLLLPGMHDTEKDGRFHGQDKTKASRGS